MCRYIDKSGLTNIKRTILFIFAGHCSAAMDDFSIRNFINKKKNSECDDLTNGSRNFPDIFRYLLASVAKRDALTNIFLNKTGWTISHTLTARGAKTNIFLVPLHLTKVNDSDSVKKHRSISEIS